METEEAEIVLVDLEELSETRFADAIVDASLVPSSGRKSLYTLKLNSGVIQTELDCSQVPVPGTFILYDKDGLAVGKSTSLLVTGRKIS